VLLRPRWAANLGAVARAMKNFGLSRLTLVGSRIGSWVDAHRMAVQAGDVLEGAAQVPDLDAALAGASWVVATTNRPLAGQPVLSPREVAVRAAERGAPTLLFGGEENGLSPAELRRCHDVSVIPTAPVQSSLNLAQAVLLYASELFQAGPAAALAPAVEAPPASRPASHDLLRLLEQKLTAALQTSQWAERPRPGHAIAELLQPFWRASVTEGEVRQWLVALGRIVQR
jgi:TrmH family RNA methyltransferase